MESRKLRVWRGRGGLSTPVVPEFRHLLPAVAVLDLLLLLEQLPLVVPHVVGGRFPGDCRVQGEDQGQLQSVEPVGSHQILKRCLQIRTERSHLMTGVAHSRNTKPQKLGWRLCEYRRWSSVDLRSVVSGTCK